MGINVRLLRRVKNHILANYKQFVMDDYYKESGENLPAKIPNCGTAACIAGWTVSLSRKEKPSESSKRLISRDVFFLAKDLLGLTENQASKLFLFNGYWGGWPSTFISKYDKAAENRRYKRKAQIAAERIEHFIKTKGAE